MKHTSACSRTVPLATRAKRPLMRGVMCFRAMEQPEIETERLILRSFNSSDARVVKELAGNYNVAKTTLNVPHPYEEGLAELWIESHPEKWNSKTGAVFAITAKDLNQLVGTVSLMDIEGTQAEIGYWIGEPFWGNGYCTEAVNALIQFSLDNLGIKKFIAEHLESNPASGKVLVKVGMHLVDTVQKVDRFGEKANIKIYDNQNT